MRAERENILPIQPAHHEVITGMVKRFENGDIILEIGRISVLLQGQSRESYAPGDRVRAVVKEATRSRA